MKRSQVSVETVILFGFITLMLIPASYMFFEYLVKSTDHIIQNRVQQIGKGFVENANLMVDYSFPKNILNITIDNNDIMIITIQTQEAQVPMPFVFGLNVTGYFNESTWTEGDKSFEFKTLPGGDAVSIRMV